jgi:hypothetical protein
LVSFLGPPTFPVFHFSSPASNQTVFILILLPVLGLANALLGGFDDLTLYSVVVFDLLLWQTNLSQLPLLV